MTTPTFELVMHDASAHTAQYRARAAPDWMVLGLIRTASESIQTVATVAVDVTHDGGYAHTDILRHLAQLPINLHADTLVDDETRTYELDVTLGMPRIVTADSLVWTDGSDAPVCPVRGVLMFELEQRARLKFVATVRRGCAAEHARWTAICNPTYKRLADGSCLMTLTSRCIVDPRDAFAETVRAYTARLSRVPTTV